MIIKIGLKCAVGFSYMKERLKIKFEQAKELF